jgi:hypothetical protein
MKEIHQADAFKDEAKNIFEQLALRQELTSSEQTQGMAASALYGLASNILTSEQALNVQQQLNDNLPARRVYRQMIKQISDFHFPQAIAAATDMLPVRNAQGCRIRLQESKAEPDQLYLIIEFSEGVKSVPRKLTVFDAEDNSFGMDLSAPRNGIIQMIIERTEKIATLLSDPKSEAFLS